MDDAVRTILLLALAAALMTVLAAMATWWLDPQRRLERKLTKLMGGQPDAVVVGAARGQAAGLRLASQAVGVIRNFEDRGLVFDLDDLIGAELFFDAQVAARIFRGEQRRALDNIAPSAGRVTIRLVFEDLHHPAFEVDVWAPGDDPKNGSAEQAVVLARNWFTRAESVIRRPLATHAAPGR